MLLPVSETVTTSNNPSIPKQFICNLLKLLFFINCCLFGFLKYKYTDICRYLHFNVCYFAIHNKIMIMLDFIGTMIHLGENPDFIKKKRKHFQRSNLTREKCFV